MRDAFTTHALSLVLPLAELHLFTAMEEKRTSVASSSGSQWFLSQVSPALYRTVSDTAALFILQQLSQLTCAMSSKQLNMYFRASFDFIPVSNSCSSGVYKIKCLSGNWKLPSFLLK